MPASVMHDVLASIETNGFSAPAFISMIKVFSSRLIASSSTPCTVG